MALLISFMFEKVTKYFASRAADGAVDGVKNSLNEKFDQYGDIIRIGLVLSVIIFGGRHITKRNDRGSYYIPQSGDYGRPIVINNYYPGYQPTQQHHDNQKRRTYDERGYYIQKNGQLGRKR